MHEQLWSVSDTLISCKCRSFGNCEQQSCSFFSLFSSCSTYSSSAFCQMVECNYGCLFAGLFMTQEDWMLCMVSRDVASGKIPCCILSLWVAVSGIENSR